jgi:hypothetical protein
VTTAVAPIGLTYAGSDLQLADLSIFLQIVHGLNETPAVRGVDAVVPALAGRVEGNRINDTIPIILEGIVRADPTTTTTATARASFRAKAASIRTLFASNRARANLVATLEDGTTTKTISARPLPGMIWNELILSEIATVSIELEGYGDWS